MATRKEIEERRARIRAFLACNPSLLNALAELAVERMMLDDCGDMLEDEYAEVDGGDFVMDMSAELFNDVTTFHALFLRLSGPNTFEVKLQYVSAKTVHDVTVNAPAVDLHVLRHVLKVTQPKKNTKQLSAEDIHVLAWKPIPPTDDHSRSRKRKGS